MQTHLAKRLDQLEAVQAPKVEYLEDWLARRAGLLKSGRLIDDGEHYRAASIDDAEAIEMADIHNRARAELQSWVAQRYPGYDPNAGPSCA